MNEMTPERHQHLMSILADAMDCDTGERGPLLIERCGADESLREEVERLLKQKNPAQGFMEEPLVDTAAGDPLDEEESVVGTQIGPYLLLEEIGRGGMGAVYLAKRSDDEYQRLVAIKLIKRGMDSALIQRRFRTERQILANLDHQNIARLFDGGTTEDGRAFLIMEYVSGQAIDVYANTRKLSTSERLKLFLPVCDAVQYAHRNQVIHRDLKPSNILVNEEGVPKLLDFGIAKFLSIESAAGSGAATTIAWRLLTPEYASPEQIGGEQSTVASDIYSLGAVLYELLTGHRPERRTGRSNTQRVSPSQVTREPKKPSQVINQVAQLPTKADFPHPAITSQSINETRDGAPERLRRSLRGDLDNIVLMALRSNPARRYSSVEEFSDDLRRHLERQPVRARGDSLPYRSRRFFQRNRTSVISGVVVALLCLLIGLSVSFLRRPPKPAITSIGVLPFINVDDDQNTQYLADGLTSSLIDCLSRLQNLKVPGRNSVLRYKGQAIDVNSAARALNVETILLGRTTTIDATVSVEVELVNAATHQSVWKKRFVGNTADILLLEQQILTGITSALGAKTSTSAIPQLPQLKTHSPEAYRLYLQGDYSWNLRSEQGLRQASEYFKAAIDRDPDYAPPYYGLAISYGLLGAYRLEKPDEIFPQAKLAALKALKLDGNLAEAYTVLGLVNWLYDWDWAEADRRFRRAIELNPGYVTAHHWYGLYLGEMGRFEEAVASENRALERDPLSPYVNADLGRVLFYARRYDESLVQYRKTTEMNPGFPAFDAEATQLYEQMGLKSEFINEAYPNLKEAQEFRQLVEQGRESYLKKFWLSISISRRSRWEKSYELARIAARLGKKDTAFELLNQAYRGRDHYMTQLKVDPAFDSLRSDPHFDELLRRMNLASPR